MNGLAGRAPLKGPGYNASFQAGTFAWAAVTAALLGEPAGEVLDIAERDVLCSTLSPAFLRQQYTGLPERRRQLADITAGPVPVADGYFALTMSRPHFWQSAMRILGLDDLAEVPELQTRGVPRGAQGAVGAAGPAGHARMEAGGPVRRPGGAAGHRRAGARPGRPRAEPAAHGAGVLPRTGRGARPAPASRGRPCATAAPAGAWPARRRAATPPRRPAGSPAPGSGLAACSGGGPPPAPAAAGPLAGYRGLVLTQAWAGTYATELLALLGAEIVQVEARGRLDSWRGSGTSQVPRGAGPARDARRSVGPEPAVQLGQHEQAVDHPRPRRARRESTCSAGWCRASTSSPRTSPPGCSGNLGIAYADLRPAARATSCW